MPLASLPMYDLPELRQATDAWWTGLAQAFRLEGVTEVPARLTRSAAHREDWTSPDLLFTQTCGYPLTHDLAGKVRLIATPRYRADGCEGASYCSFVLVREDSPARGAADLRGLRCAVNNLDSQSGYSALRGLVAPLARAGRFFGDVSISGSHVASIGMLAAGTADVAAVDCVTIALARRIRPSALAGIRILCRTASAPSLPYVTAFRASDDLVRRLQAGLRRAVEDPDMGAARDALLIDGTSELALDAYRRIGEIEEAALAHGYARVA